MPTPPLEQDEVMRRVDCARHFDWNYNFAARALNIGHKTIARACDLAREKKWAPDIPSGGQGTVPVQPYDQYPPWQPDPAKPSTFLPDFGDDDVPVTDIIEMQKRRFAKRFAHHQKKQWFPVKMPETKPILLALVGDPHVDDDGCNWPLLERDVALMRDTPGVYAVQVGDASNNWAGRLSHLYAHQEASKKTAYKLVKWLMKDSGVPWLLWLLGNHDEWGDGAAVLHEMAAGALEVFDWQAKFRLTFPNGVECAAHLAHNFKGQSIYNPAHGMARAAKFGQVCPQLFGQGHHHEYHVLHGVYEDLNRTFWAVKVRGYKWIDSYADRHQFGQNTFGATAGILIDPTVPATAPGFMHVYDDLQEACDILTWKRGRL